MEAEAVEPRPRQPWLRAHAVLRAGLLFRRPLVDQELLHYPPLLESRRALAGAAPMVAPAGP